VAADQPGTYRLRITARRQIVERLPYRLHVRRRGPPTDLDDVRMSVRRLWQEGTRLYARGGRDARQAALAAYDEALRLVAPLDEPDDEEDEARTLATMAAVHYVRSDAAAGSAAARRALAIWDRLGRDREAGVVLSDLGLLEYLAYRHAEARGYYEQALTRLRAAGETEGEAVTLVRLGWVEFATGEMARAIELNHRAIPLWQRVGNAGGESVSLNDLGRANAELGEVALALDAYQGTLARRPADVDRSMRRSRSSKTSFIRQWARGRPDHTRHSCSVRLPPPSPKTNCSCARRR